MRKLTALTAGLLAAALLAPAGATRANETPAVAPVQAAEAEKTGQMRFRVERGGDPIGTHALTFRRAGDRLTVEVAIDLEVGIGPIPLFEYNHRNTTTWRNGHVVAMTTRTDDDGDEYAVDARRGNSGELTVRTKDGSRTIDGDLLPSTYWMTSTVDAERLLNTQKGTVGQIEVERNGTRTVQLPGGRTVEAAGYVMRGDIDTAVWYDADGRWVSLAFDAKGDRITYQLIERSGYIPTRPPQPATAQQAPGAG